MQKYNLSGFEDYVRSYNLGKEKTMFRENWLMGQTPENISTSFYSEGFDGIVHDNNKSDGMPLIFYLFKINYHMKSFRFINS